MKTRIRQLTEQEKRSLGEQQMLSDWMKDFPNGILSVVSDTFDLWKLITEYLPALKEQIMSRNGKLVIRPDSGNPVDIVCGWPSSSEKTYEEYVQYGIDHDLEAFTHKDKNSYKGVIELLWDIFGGTINEQGYKMLDSHIGAIYGDSITLERQQAIYERLADKGFASTNIVLGVGSFTYGYNTRDTFGFAAKGAWFEVEERDEPCKNCTDPNCIEAEKSGAKDCLVKKAYNIYKNPVTDDGRKRSLKGLLCVINKCNCGHTITCDCGSADIIVKQECTWKEENEGLLQVIYENGNFYNQTTLKQIREKIKLKK